MLLDVRTRGFRTFVPTAKQELLGELLEISRQDSGKTRRQRVVQRSIGNQVAGVIGRWLYADGFAKLRHK